MIMKIAQTLKNCTILVVALGLLLFLLGGGQAAPGQGPQAPDALSGGFHHPLDGGMPGPYPVGHTSFVSQRDEGRLVGADIYYPADADRITRRSREAVYAVDVYDPNLPSMTSSQWEAMGYDRAYEAPVRAPGQFPLIVFATGAGVPSFGYLYLGTRLASHGYIVAVVQGYREGIWPDQEYDESWYALFYHRPRDMSFALDEMLRRDSNRRNLLHNAIDRRHLVAAGHSLGGYTAYAELGGDAGLGDAKDFAYWGETVPPVEYSGPTLPDPRFTALISMDGTQELLRWEELSRIRVPSLIIGQASWADGENALPDPQYWSYLGRPHAAISAHTRALRADIAQVDHMSFAQGGDGITILLNAGLISAEVADYQSWMYPGVASGKDTLPILETQRIIAKYVVAFLNTEVRQDESELSERILTQEYTLNHEPNVEVWWNERCRPQGRIQPGTFTYFTDMAPDSWTVDEKNPLEFFDPIP
jgi:hypothetical protein